MKEQANFTNVLRQSKQINCVVSDFECDADDEDESRKYFLNVKN